MDERLLTPYEEAAYRGRAKTAADRAIERSLIRDSVLSVLSCESKFKTLPGGERIAVTYADELAAETIRDAIENPDTRKLKDLAFVAGEARQGLDVSLRGAEELFGDIAIPGKGPADGE